MNQAQIDSFYPLTLAVRRLFHKLGHGVSELHRETGISGGMRAELESVIARGPQTVPQMARVRPVSRQHIQGLVNALLDAGLVKMAENPAHKRSKLVVPTESGRAAFAAMRARETEAFGQLSLDCSAAELAAAGKVLRSLIDVFDGPEWRAIAGDTSPETED
jgi:DNA-binding MarR family transcriptional regulator